MCLQSYVAKLWRLFCRISESFSIFEWIARQNSPNVESCHLAWPKHKESCIDSYKIYTWIIILSTFRFLTHRLIIFFCDVRIRHSAHDCQNPQKAREKFFAEFFFCELKEEEKGNMMNSKTFSPFSFCSIQFFFWGGSEAKREEGKKKRIDGGIPLSLTNAKKERE